MCAVPHPAIGGLLGRVALHPPVDGDANRWLRFSSGSDRGDGVVEDAHRFPDGVLAHPQDAEGEVVVRVVAQETAGPDVDPLLLIAAHPAIAGHLELKAIPHHLREALPPAVHLVLDQGMAWSSR